MSRKLINTLLVAAVIITAVWATLAIMSNYQPPGQTKICVPPSGVQTCPAPNPHPYGPVAVSVTAFTITSLGTAIYFVRNARKHSGPH